jgi:hypothetical protein
MWLLAVELICHYGIGAALGWESTWKTTVFCGLKAVPIHVLTQLVSVCALKFWQYLGIQGSLIVWYHYFVRRHWSRPILPLFDGHTLLTVPSIDAGYISVLISCP